jgi:DNA primase
LRGDFAPRATGGRSSPYLVVSQQMAASPLYRGARTSVPLREALLLQAALNHPWLLHDHLEDLSQLEFRYPDAERLKSAIIDLFAHNGDHGGSQSGSLDPAALSVELIRQGFDDVMARIARSITTPDVWGARPDAAAADVLVTWGQLVALHRQWHSLTKELKDAEFALGEDSSEANYLRLRDVKTRLTAVEGTEALIEGFGASSGRPASSV